MHVPGQSERRGERAEETGRDRGGADVRRAEFRPRGGCADPGETEGRAGGRGRGAVPGSGAAVRRGTPDGPGGCDADAVPGRGVPAPSGGVGKGAKYV